MIEKIKKLLKQLEFAPMGYVLPDGKKAYIAISDYPISTVMIEEDQINKFESEKS